MSKIPLQQDCNLEDPEEAFLWMFSGLPGLEAQAPMLVPPQVARRWSKRMWDAGARPHPELQTIKYVPPSSQQHWLAGAGGKWVPVDQPLPPAVTAPSTDHLSVEEKEILAQRFAAEGIVPPADDGDVAEVSGHGG